MKFILLLPIVFILTVAGLSQATAIDKTKYNGIWVFDAKASKADSDTRKRYIGHDLTIVYTEPEFRVTLPRTRDGETRSATVLFFTDGRGEVTKPYAFNQNAEFDSVTKWEKGSLVRNYSIPININGKRSGSIDYIEKYSVSEDGMSLTIITESAMDEKTARAFFGQKRTAGESRVSVKRVYKKK